MVRINLITPAALTDQHLIAEHNEILMLCGSFYKSLKSKGGINKIPDRFTLNKGHIKFFYNKGRYLHKRFNVIQAEMVRRGFSPTKIFPQHYWPIAHYQDWMPSEEDVRLVMERIEQKIALKPDWYRYYGKKLGCASPPKPVI